MPHIDPGLRCWVCNSGRKCASCAELWRRWDQNKSQHAKMACASEISIEEGWKAPCIAKQGLCDIVAAVIVLNHFRTSEWEGQACRLCVSARDAKRHPPPHHNGSCAQRLGWVATLECRVFCSPRNPSICPQGTEGSSMACTERGVSCLPHPVLANAARCACRL